MTVRLPDLGEAREALRLLEKLRVRPLRRYRWNSSAWAVAIPARECDPWRFAGQFAAQNGKDIYSACPEFLRRLRQNGAWYERQWQWHGRTSASPTAHSYAEKAWATGARGSGIRIAVIDQAFDQDHPNLRDAVLGGSAYFPPEGGIHFEPTALEPVSSGNLALAHGTACAGMAGARQSGSADLCGAAPDSRLMLLGLDAYNSAERFADAITYAADPSTFDPDAHPSDGAHVISSSLATTGVALPPGPGICVEDPVLEALEFAGRKGREGLGIPIFWAVHFWRGALVKDDRIASSEYVIAVGQTNRADKHDTNDDFGDNARGVGLALVAPGDEVCVLKANPGSGDPGITWTGTSLATPLAAGVAALILSVRPDLTREQVRKVLLTTCDKVPSASCYDATGFSDEFGYGRVNALRAVDMARGLP
jgi:thermitase